MTARERPRYKAVSPFPAALRDLAVLVDAATPGAEVQRTLLKLARTATGGAFTVEQVRLFDVYAGQGIPEGKKNLAVSFAYRAPDRTLTDDEVNTAFTRLQTEAEKSGLTLRK